MNKQKKKKRRLFNFIIQVVKRRKRQRALLKISDTVDRCTLYQFKMVHLTSDYRYLLRGIDYENLPDVDQNDLVDAWVGLENQWSELTGNNQADLSLLRKKIITQIKYDYTYQIILYHNLELLPIQELVDIFNEHGYGVDLEDYENTMARSYARLKRKKAQYELEEGNEDTDSDPVDFDELIVLLEKEQGYAFDEQRMTVRKFAKIYKKVTSDGKRQNNKK